MGRKIVEPVPDTLDTSGCLYEMAGKLCGAAVRARGYCAKHYKVLNRRGAFKPAAPLEPGSAVTEAQIDRNLGHLARARLALEQHTEAIVGHLMTAVEVAARKGDSRPAEWSLLHARALEPVLTGGGASGKGAAEVPGIRVMIGVQLGQPVPQASQPAMHTIVHKAEIMHNDSVSAQPAAIGQIAGDIDRTLETLPTLDGQLIQA